MFSNGIGQSVGTFKWLATICKRIRMEYEARAEQISNLAPSAATIFSLRPAHLMEGASLAGICMTWPGKLILSKKHLKTPKLMENFSDRLPLEGAGGQTGDTRSTFRPP